jgi:hypothetical protein
MNETRHNIDVARYMQPSRLVPRAMELTPAGELLAETISGQIAQVWADMCELDDHDGETAKALLERDAELEALYVALTKDTVPGAHGLRVERRMH